MFIFIIQNLIQTSGGVFYDVIVNNLFNYVLTGNL
jgi:hypothetical protein